MTLFLRLTIKARLFRWSAKLHNIHAIMTYAIVIARTLLMMANIIDNTWQKLCVDDHRNAGIQRRLLLC